MLYPSIIVFCCIGIYSINNSPTDVVIAAIFGLIGYWLVKHDFEPAPLVLAFVLGPLMEENSTARHVDRARRCHRVRDPADLGRTARSRDLPAGAGSAADDPQTTRRSVRRMSWKGEPVASGFNQRRSVT